MKLIKCYIENFGKLSNADYNFDERLTGFCENNGFGKTTLAAFIKAMFYGLPSVRVNAKEFNDRKHFYPFAGGKFGGNLTFETGGATYRIERFFGKKSDTEDELTVYCNNRVYGGFGGDLGKAVFGVDKETFERTVFITSDAADTTAAGGMLTKLNCFVENADGEEDFETVIARLERARKNLKAAKGNNDLISQTNQAIFEVKSEIANLESIAKTLDESYSRKNNLQKSILRAEAEIEEIKNTNLVLERWEKLDAMTARCNRLREELDGWRSKYAGGLPSEEENLLLKSNARRITMLDGAQTTAAFDCQKQEKLSLLECVFQAGVPEECALRKLSGDIDEIKSLEVKISALSEEDGGQRRLSLQRKFANKTPDAEQMEYLEDKVQRYRNLDNRRKAQAAVAAPFNAPASKSGKVYSVLLALFAIVAVAGGALVLVSKIAGIALLAGGVLAAAVVAVLWKIKGSQSSPKAVVLDGAAIEAQAELQSIEGAVREVLASYGYYSQNGIIFDYETFKKDLNDYAQYGEDELRRRERIHGFAQRKDALTENARNFFAQYGISDGDLQSAYVKLFNMISEYGNLKADSVRAETGVKDTRRQAEQLYAEISGVLGKYSIRLEENVFAQLEEIERASAETARLCGEIEKCGKEAADYAAKYGLGQRPSAEIADYSLLAERVKEERNLLAVVDGQIASDEAMIETLGDKYGALETLQEKLNGYKRRHYVLSETEKLLKKADRNLKDRYVAPVKDVFLKYADVIEETLGERITIDEEFNVLFEQSGEIHSEKHFSTGLRSICALCMRLAFVENMFGGEKPFIIMDDPFVFLDGGHMQKTMRVVKELAKDIQIIYFCCHESRRAAV